MLAIKNISNRHRTQKLSIKHASLDYCFATRVVYHQLDNELVRRMKLSGGAIFITNVHVEKKYRSDGRGTSLMTLLLEYFEHRHMLLQVAPEKETERNLDRLVDWYNQFNFVLLGKKTLHAFMYREPTGNPPCQFDAGYVE